MPLPSARTHSRGFAFCTATTAPTAIPAITSATTMASTALLTGERLVGGEGSGSRVQLGAGIRSSIGAWRLCSLGIRVSRAGVPRGNRTGGQAASKRHAGCPAKPRAMQAQTPKRPNWHGRYPVGCRQACHEATPAPLIAPNQKKNALIARADTEGAFYQRRGLGVSSAACLLFRMDMGSSRG